MKELWVPTVRQAQQIFLRYGVLGQQARNRDFNAPHHSYMVYGSYFSSKARDVQPQASVWHKGDHWLVNFWIDGHCTTPNGLRCLTFHSAVKKARELLLGLDAVRRLTGGEPLR